MNGVGRFLKRFLEGFDEDDAWTDPDTERVVEVHGSTVVTEIDGQRCTYRDCVGRYSVGDVIEAPIKHRTRSYAIKWSPWDAPEDD